MIDSIDFKKPAFEPVTAFRNIVELRHAELVISRTDGPVDELQTALLVQCASLQPRVFCISAVDENCVALFTRKA